MKATLFILLLVLLRASPAAQDSTQNTNSLFDDSPVRTYSPGNVLVQGEVQNPGTVDLSLLPIQTTVVKELGLEKGKSEFKGAFLASGYSLYDILNNKKAKKAPQNTFAPPVDMYAVVENEKGQKAVFSWGEIYYRESFNILITRSIRAINPSRTKTSWPLPETPLLVCATDQWNVRFISNPTKITVKSYRSNDGSEKPKDVYSPAILMTSGTGSAVIRDIGPSVERRHYQKVLYGHGMGFKGVLSFTGCLLKDLIAANFKIAPENLRETFAVVSAKDGYRSVFSVSEIMNRNDNMDFLLNDLGESSKDGRYTLIGPDFFADRNVKSVEKIELVNID